MRKMNNSKKAFYSNANSVVKKKAFILILIFIFAVVLGLIFLVNFDTFKDDFTKKKNQDNSTNVTTPDKQTSYITETCYDGTKELDPVLFQFPFQKTEYYMNNKTLITKLSEKKVEDMQNRAAEFVSTFYGCDNRKLLTEYAATEQKLNDYFLDDYSYIDENGLEKVADTYIADYLKGLSDQEIQTDVTYETDKCLIFKDINYYIRGLVTITVYEGTDSDVLKAYYPFSLEKGKTYKVVLDIGLVPFTSNVADTYKVSEINVVDWQEITEIGTETDDEDINSKSKNNTLITIEESGDKQ